MESYRLQIKKSASKELESVGAKKDRQRLVRAINALARDPRPQGCEKLSAEENKYRQGNYRIVYSVDDRARLVLVAKIGDRKEVYR